MVANLSGQSRKTTTIVLVSRLEPVFCSGVTRPSTWCLFTWRRVSCILEEDSFTSVCGTSEGVTPTLGFSESSSARGSSPSPRRFPQKTDDETFAKSPSGVFFCVGLGVGLALLYAFLY